MPFIFCGKIAVSLWALHCRSRHSPDWFKSGKGMFHYSNPTMPNRCGGVAEICSIGWGNRQDERMQANSPRDSLLSAFPSPLHSIPAPVATAFFFPLTLMVTLQAKLYPGAIGVFKMSLFSRWLATRRWFSLTKIYPIYDTHKEIYLHLFSGWEGFLRNFSLPVLPQSQAWKPHRHFPSENKGDFLLTRST